MSATNKKFYEDSGSCDIMEFLGFWWSGTSWDIFSKLSSCISHLPLRERHALDTQLHLRVVVWSIIRWLETSNKNILCIISCRYKLSGQSDHINQRQKETFMVNKGILWNLLQEPTGETTDKLLGPRRDWTVLNQSYKWLLSPNCGKSQDCLQQTNG